MVSRNTNYNRKRVIPPRPHSRGTPVFPKLCGCGCGERPLCIGSAFLPGHNARVDKRSVESNRKRSETLMGHEFWGTEEGTAQMRESLIRRYINCPSYRGQISKSIRELWQTHPEYWENMGIDNSINMKQWWSIPEFRDERVYAIAVGNGLNGSRLEEEFNKVLIKGNLPFKKNDGSFVVGGKIPDFWCTEGRQLIEVYGNYWHQGQDPSVRIRYFEKLGYKTLVLWESEIKSVEDEELISFISSWHANPELNFKEYQNSLDKCVETIDLAPVVAG